MSRMYFTERGRMTEGHNEEITHYRWARKKLKLPATAAGAKADLWLCLAMYSGNRTPLRIDLNGRMLAKVSPTKRLRHVWGWKSVPVPAGRLKVGVNDILIRADNLAMNGWVLGIEGGYANPRSYLSHDQGRTWSNHAMGIDGITRGEYLVRLRSGAEKLRSLTLPRVVYEDARHRRVKAAAGLIPARIRRMVNPWRRLLSLRTWIAASWQHRGGPGAYTPWDPWTVLDWKDRQWSHSRNYPSVAFCVHFGTLMIALASAMGCLARGVATTGDLASISGHFMAEVWDHKTGRWVLHDPTFDIHYEDGSPLSAIDIAQRSLAGQYLKPLVRSGAAFARSGLHQSEGLEQQFYTGKSLQIASIYSRNNFVSDPTAAPPAHGILPYTETDFVWFDPTGKLTPMFPYRTADRRYFDAAPQSS